MKNLYEEPVVVITKFHTENVVTASSSTVTLQNALAEKGVTTYSRDVTANDLFGFVE